MRKHPHVVGHWHGLIEGFATSFLDCYELVKTSIERREIPDLKVSSVEWKESGVDRYGNLGLEPTVLSNGQSAPARRPWALGTIDHR